MNLLNHYKFFLNISRTFTCFRDSFSEVISDLYCFTKWFDYVLYSLTQIAIGSKHPHSYPNNDKKLKRFSFQL